MNNPIFAIQQAVYNALAASSLITCDIVDVPVIDKAFPYIRVGDAFATYQGAKNEYHFEVSHTIHVFSRAAGNWEAEEIMAAIEETLRNAELYLSEFGFEEGYRTLAYSTITGDSDGVTRDGILEYNHYLNEIK